VCPFSSIQDAIDISADGDTVVVHEGTYTENIDFLGKLITVVSLDGARRTIIRGQLTPLGEPSSVVTFAVRGGQEEYWGAHGSVGQGEVLVPSSGEGPVLDGFTITGGSGSRLMGVKNAMTPVGLMNIGTFGGGVYCDRTSPTIANCIIRGNSAGGGGGGISSWKAYPRIVNCVISGNRSSRDGGGIYCGNGTVRLEHTTVTGNAAGRRGGGISCYTSVLSVAGSIVWGNTTNGAPDNIRECERFSRIAYSTIGGPGFKTREEGTIWPGEGNIKADPLFREAVYAEESPTTAGDYRLTAGSPAVDSGAATGPDRDLDGVSRPQGGGRDMGAYEFAAGPSVEESPFGDQ
jgi:predicted outer membrane repeat protein